MKHLVLAFLMAIFLSSPPSYANEICLNYGPAVVTLTGQVTIKTFYGPPGYGETPEKDARNTQAIMLLEKPVCTIANPDNFEGAESNQAEVTLVPGEGMRFSDHAGKRISVSGTLFHSHSGHHHTPVLISVNEIKTTGK